MSTTVSPQTYEVDAADAIEFCYEQGWTDGLPVVPPTRERVAEMLEYVGLEADEVIGLVPLKQRRVTAGKLATNAVMAGCLPAYMPILVTAVQALTDERYGLAAAESSTGGGAPLCIVGGPGAEQIGLNGGANAFGPGVRANATIGRAIRLLMLNVTGARPGLEDRSTLGHPGKYTYCIAENEAVSPWEPLHVARGCHPDSTAVTVFQAGGHIQAENYWSEDTESILLTFADLMVANGRYRDDPNQCVLIVCPEHAETFQKDGWGRRQVQEFLWEKIGRSVAELKRRNRMPGQLEPGDEDRTWRFLEAPDDILLAVAGGGAGRKSILIPAWSGKYQTVAVTREVGECETCKL
jgi:hypothetical protein